MSHSAGPGSVGRVVARTVVGLVLLALLGTTGACTGSPVDRPTPPAQTPDTESYPDATTTGARGQLTAYDGDATVTDPGRVIEDVEITGRLTIEADNVTLRNVRVSSGDYWAVLNYGRNTRIEDSTLVGTATTQALIGDIDGGNFIGVRLDASGAADGIKMGANSKLYDSYIHDLASFEGAHNDGIEMTAAVGAEVVHNTVLNQNSQTSAIFLGDFVAGQVSAVRVENNLLAGGGYTIYGGAPELSGALLAGNLISTRFFPNGGSYGPVSYWNGSANQAAGNVWADGPQAGGPIDLGDG